MLRYVTVRAAILSDAGRRSAAVAIGQGCYRAIARTGSQPGSRTDGRWNVRIAAAPQQRHPKGHAARPRPPSRCSHCARFGARRSFRVRHRSKGGARIERSRRRHLRHQAGKSLLLRGRRRHRAAVEGQTISRSKPAFPAGRCSTRQHVVVPDIYADERIPHDAYRPTFVKSLVMVPVRREDPIAAIGAYWADYHAATPAEIGVLQSLADAAALALSNVQLDAESEGGAAPGTRSAGQSPRARAGSRTNSSRCCRMSCARRCT